MILLQKWVNLVKIGDFFKSLDFKGFGIFPESKKKNPNRQL